MSIDTESRSANFWDWGSHLQARAAREGVAWHRRRASDDRDCNRDEVLRRIHDLLKPGGRFVSTTPCMGENQWVMRVINRALSLAKAARIIPYGKFFAAPELEQSIPMRASR